MQSTPTDQQIMTTNGKDTLDVSNNATPLAKAPWEVMFCRGGQHYVRDLRTTSPVRLTE